MHPMHPRRRRSNAAISRCACITLLAATFCLGGCAGAFYGGAAGAYVAGGGSSCWNGGSSRCVYDGRGGGSSDVFLAGAIAVGAAIGAIAEIIDWMCNGGR